MARHKKKPSLFLGSLAGYAIATAVGVLATILLSIHAGRASAVGGLKLLTSAGILGILLGYEIAVWRRKRRGIAGPYDEMSRFIGSWMAGVLVVILLAGSFGLALAIKL